MAPPGRTSAPPALTTARNPATTRGSAPSTSPPPPSDGAAALFRASGGTRTGSRRAKNEDRWLLVESRGSRPLLAAVADGVGGEVGGERASAAALAALEAHWSAWLPTTPPSPDEIARRLEDAGRAADDAVRALGDRDPQLRRAATTLSAAALRVEPPRAPEVHVLHAGDSRVYRIHPSGGVDLLTTDHTWVESAVRSGELTTEEAATHPKRNVIVEFLGRPDGCVFETSATPLAEGDALLLCTDGVSNVLSPDDLGHAVRSARDEHQVAQRVLALVAERDGADDATLVAVLPARTSDPFGLRRVNAPSRAASVARASRRPLMAAAALGGGAALLAAVGVAASRLLGSGPRPTPEADAQRFLDRFHAGEYDALYDSLGRRARSSIDRAAFVQRHEAIAAEMTLSALELRLSPVERQSSAAAGGTALLPFEALYRTARFGDLQRRNELPLVWEDGRWAVDWTPAVILPELGGGRLVRAVSDPAPRGSILDRGARPLAASPGAASRTYPAGDTAGPITGYVGQVSADELKALASKGFLAGDSIGRAGIEAAHEAHLAGQRGGRLTIIQPNGALADTLATVPPRAGESVVLTIDLELQREVETALGNRPGSALVIDARTGAIRVLASAPRYDPNAFSRDGNPGPILGDPAQPLLVRPLHGQYPPGSTFKVVTMAAALESGAFTPTSEFTCTGRWSGLPGLTFDCWLRTGHGRLNLVDGLTHSCNTVFYEIGKRLDELDANALPATAARCGVGTPVGVAAGIESPGVAPSPAWKQRTLRDGWARGDAVNMAIGQGHLLMTPLQLASIYLGIASSGQGPGLRLVERTLLPGGSVERTLPSASPTVNWSAPTLEAIRTGLRNVVGTPTGTAAHIFQGSPLAALVAGKTGTAEAGPGRPPHAWFACYAPHDAPRAVVLVMVENAGEGSAVAAPLARRVLEAVLDRL